MAASRTGIVLDFETRALLSSHTRGYRHVRYPKPGMGTEVFRGVFLWLPVTCAMWAGIIYGVLKLAR